jgi:hypothetical protein
VIETLTRLDHRKQPDDRDVQAGGAHAFRLQCKFNKYCSRLGHLGGRLVLAKPACGRYCSMAMSHQTRGQCWKSRP